MDESDLDADPVQQLASWLAVARRSGVIVPESMALATASSDGTPSVRMVIMRGLDTGLVFYTDRESDKAADLRGNPLVAALFHWWLPVQRQVRASGPVVDVSSAESDRYWQARPPGARWMQIASHQSRVLADRGVLDAALEEARARFINEDAIPRPERWTGYRLVPTVIEFWEEGQQRTPDRIRYRRAGNGWVSERLSP